MRGAVLRLLPPLMALMLLTLAGCVPGERAGADAASAAAAGQDATHASGSQGDAEARGALDASLAGSAWRLVDGLADVDPADVDITLAFEPGLAAISGSGGCNQYRAELQHTDGDGVRIGPALATKRGCPGPRGRAEPAFFAALSNIERFEQQGDRLLAQRTNGPPLEFKRDSAATPR